MKKLGLLLLPILAITLILGGNAFAQNVGDSSYFFVTYYSNANTSGAPDGTLRIVNDGAEETGPASEGPYNGTLWAAIYVFDDSQEMRSCCACSITSNGLLSESVNKELTSNEFSGRGQIQRGVIKVVSSSNNNPYGPAPLTGLRGWMTHIQATTNGIPVYPATCIGDCALDTSKGPWFVTETALADSNLSATELGNLGGLCSYGINIGSGFGACPCTPEDYDF
jgi:hypothetical protein